MATYGSYETVGRIFSIGARSVYSARKAEGGKKDEFVVKVLTPEDALGEDPEVLRRAFVERASIQVRLTQAKARVWVATHEQGAVGGDVFYVTDRVPSTAQQLISGKVRLSHADLSRVVSRVLEGLRELRAASNRAHANLKPSNVLIASSGDIASSTVLLTDPSGNAEAARAEAEFDDVRALGDLIHQLVLMAPFRAMGGYPITESAAWTRLGKSGEQWRALANRLLDPAGRPGSISIEQIAGEVQQFKGDRAGGGNKVVPLAIGAVALALLAGGGYFAFTMLGQKEPDDNGGGGGGGGENQGGGQALRFSPESWSSWCLSARWATTMKDRLGSRRQALSSDPFLSENLLPLIDSPVALSPRSLIVSVSIRNPADFAQAPPEDADDALVVKATADALAWIGSIESTIWDGQWPALRAITDAGDRLESVGLTSFAGAARQRAAEFARLRDGLRTQGQERSPDSVDALLDAVARVSREGAAYADLLSALPQSVEAGATPAPGLRQLANTLMARGVPGEEEVRSLAQFIRGTPEVFVASAPPPDPDPIDPDPIEPVVDIGPDPREQGWDAPSRLARERDRLNEEWTGQVVDDAATRALSDARAALDQAAALVTSAAEPDWILESRDQIRDAMTRAGDAIGSATSAIDQARAQFDIQVARAAQQQQTEAQAAQAHAEFVQAYRDHTPETLRSDFLREQWTNLREEHLAEHAEPADLNDLRQARAELERRIALVEGALASPPEISQGPPGFDSGAVQTFLADQREREVRALWQDGLADDFGDAFRTRAEQRLASLTGVYEATRRYARDMALASDALTAQRAWDDTLAPGDPPETLATINARWEASLPPPPLVPAMGDAPARLAALASAMAAVASTDARPDLAALISDPAQPIQAALAAWRKLPDPEALDLSIEQQSVERLRQALSAAPDRAASQRALAAIEQDAARRWQIAVERARTRAEYVAVMAWYEPLASSIDLGDLPPRVFFNVQLLGSVARVEQLGASPADAELRAALQRILDLADAPQNQPLWQGDAATRNWLDSIRAALTQQSSGPDLSRAGPASAGGGWQYDAASSTPTRAVYRLAGNSETIEFARLDPGDGLTQPVYLSTTEVSVRLFNAAANAAGLWASLAPAWGDVLTSNDWAGPRTWLYSRQGGLTANRKWLFVEGTDGNSVRDPFAPSVRPPPPSDDMPVQHITAAAAIEFARGVGCRLPTGAEWRAARGRVETGGGWNLRDQAWQTQQAYVRQRRAQAGNPPPYPDESVFIPDARFGDIPTEADAQPAGSASDGALLFTPVDAGAGSTFKNLVGNVAEFVNDAPPGATPRLGVIGGSALSAPELSPDEVLSFDGYFPDQDTFPDVGFRLAFDAGAAGGGGPTLAQQAPALLANLSLVAP